MIKLGLVEFIEDESKRRAELKEQREMRDAEIKELDVRMESIHRELFHIDDQLEALKSQKLEARAKLNDLLDRWGELMEMQHES